MPAGAARRGGDHVVEQVDQGRGRDVVAALAATTIYDAVAFQYFGRLRGRVGARFAPTQPTIATLPCADGFIGIHAALHGMWVTLANLCGHPELVEDPRFASPVDRAARVDELDGYLLPWLATLGRWELYHFLQRHRVCASALPTLDEVLASPQLAVRDAWRTVSTPSGRSFRVPGPPARVLATADPAAVACAMAAAMARVEPANSGSKDAGRARLMRRSGPFQSPRTRH